MDVKPPAPVYGNGQSNDADAESFSPFSAMILEVREGWQRLLPSKLHVPSAPCRMTRLRPPAALSFCG